MGKRFVAACLGSGIVPYEFQGSTSIGGQMVLFVKDRSDTGGKSVTSGVEAVISHLAGLGLLSPKCRVLYEDSQGIVDEIVLTPDLKFSRFVDGDAVCRAFYNRNFRA